MKKSSLKKVFKLLSTAALIFIAAAGWSLVFHETHDARIEIAFIEFQRARAARIDLNASHLREIKELALKALQGTTPSEDALIQRRLSRIISAREAADDKLAKAKKKFCDLAGERVRICQKPQKPVIFGWLI